MVDLGLYIWNLEFQFGDLTWDLFINGLSMVKQLKLKILLNLLSA